MSKRKSVGRRRSRSLCGLQAKDFCETIPKDLPESERLLKLIELSFRYAFKKALKHAKVKENFDSSSFLAKEDDYWENTKAVIVERNLHKSAVENNGQSECRKKGQWDEDIKLFEAESEKWSNLVMASRESLTKEMSASYSIDASTVKKSVEYNYDDIMEEMSHLENGLSKKISRLSEINYGLKQGLILSKYVEIETKKECEKYFHKEVENSPGTMLRRFKKVPGSPRTVVTRK